jgi:radical SAM protein with 4Fe4S-binding SPASM domain
MSRTLYLSRLRKMITVEGESLARALDERRGWRPREVEIRLTCACEDHCEQCGMHEHARAAGPAYSRRLPTGRVLEVLTELAGLGCESVLFSGGEVTLVKELPELVRQCSRLGIAAHINTHGGNLSEPYCDQLLECGLRGLMVSLDSPDAVQHDTIRRLPGLFARATSGLAYLRRRRPGQEFYMLINSVIMRHNYRKVPRLVDVVADLGLSELSLSPLSIDNPWDDWANQGQSPALKLTDADERELGAVVLPEALRRAAARRVTLMHPGNVNQDGTVTIPQRTMHEVAVNCAVVHYHAVINVNGDVIPCCYSSPETYRMGNVGEASFVDVWNGPEYQAFRQGCFPARYEMCASCSQHRNENELLERWYKRRHGPG